VGPVRINSIELICSRRKDAAASPSPLDSYLGPLVSRAGLLSDASTRHPSPPNSLVKALLAPGRHASADLPASAPHPVASPPVSRRAGWGTARGRRRNVPRLGARRPRTTPRSSRATRPPSTRSSPPCKSSPAPPVSLVPRVSRCVGGRRGSVFVGQLILAFHGWVMGSRC
jgi:hypothetical protein